MVKKIAKDIRDAYNNGWRPGYLLCCARCGMSWTEEEPRCWYCGCYAKIGYFSLRGSEMLKMIYEKDRLKEENAALRADNALKDYENACLRRAMDLNEWRKR
ncbi:MAG: hypothetical protein PHS46_08000 [Candidatus Omnitrophica bacterium]|nr:hypothetical protein [Candidatus Omnitrophota bacterium]